MIIQAIAATDLPVTSVAGRLLLVGASVSMASAGLMMVKVQTSNGGSAAYRALRLAGASTFAGLVALGAAFYIS